MRFCACGRPRNSVRSRREWTRRPVLDDLLLMCSVRTVVGNGRKEIYIPYICTRNIYIVVIYRLTHNTFLITSQTRTHSLTFTQKTYTGNQYKSNTEFMYMNVDVIILYADNKIQTRADYTIPWFCIRPMMNLSLCFLFKTNSIADGLNQPYAELFF